LAVGTSYIINRGKIKYAWITIAPMLFVGITTVYAAVLNIKNIYLPQTSDSTTFTQGTINMTLSVVILGCAFVVFYNAITQWIKAYSNRNTMQQATDE
jgi:carbon starvation protein